MNLKILAKQERDRYNGRRQHILQYPAARMLFIIACILADTITLWSVVDLMLKQQPIITIVITLTVASVINIAPMLAASFLKNDEYKTGSKIVVCTALACLFAVLFAATFSLRYTSQEQLYGSATDIKISIEANEQTGLIEEEEFTPTAAQNILAILLGLEPLATSICTFVLTYEFSEKRKRLHLNELQIIRLEEDIIRYKTMRDELLCDMEFDLDGYDTTLYEELRALITQLGENAKIQARRRLCEADSTPEGVSLLMEDEDQRPRSPNDSPGGASSAESNSIEAAGKRTRSVA